MSNLQSFASNYRSMTDDDLRRVALDIRNIVPQAREALRLEFRRRDLFSDDIDWEAQPSLSSVSNKPELRALTGKRRKSNGLFSIFFRNFLICVVCNGLLCAGATTILFRTVTMDWEKLGEAIARFVLYGSVFLGFVTAKFISPARYGRVWLIAMVAPAGVILLVLATILMRLHQ